MIRANRSSRISVNVQAPARRRPRSLAPSVVAAAWIALFAGCNEDSQVPNAATSQPVGSPITEVAEDGPVKLTVGVDRDAVSGTETFEFTVAVEAERGVQVKIPQYEGIIGDFSITGSKQGQPTESAMTARVEHRYTLQGVLPGDREIPAVTVEYTDDRERADGSDETITGSVTSKPITIKVDVALAGMKDPATLPMPLPTKIILWAVGVIATVAAIALLARWWRQRPPSRIRSTERRPVPHEWALAELYRLFAEDLPGQGRVQEFYYRINGLIRRYIEMRFGLMAAEQTSEEFIRSLGESPRLGESHKNVLREFTGVCDPVKYAAMQPDKDDIEWVRKSAEKFIHETSPSSTRDAEPARMQETEGVVA